MRNFILPAILIVVAVSACKEPFRKGSNGIEYKIISSGKGEHLKQNDFMQIHVTQLYQNRSQGFGFIRIAHRPCGPMIEMVDSFSTPPQYFGILTQLRKGDSLVMRSLTDRFTPRPISCRFLSKRPLPRNHGQNCSIFSKQGHRPIAPNRPKQPYTVNRIL